MRFGLAAVVSSYVLLTIPSTASAAKFMAVLLQQSPQAPPNLLAWAEAAGRLGTSALLIVAVVALWREYLNSRSKGVADTVASVKLIETIESNTRATEAAARSIEKLLILLENK